MTDTDNRDLTEQLERAAGRVHVGSPPVDAMVDAASRVRRRARARAVVVMTMLAVVLGGIGVAVRDDGAPRIPVAGEDRAVPGMNSRTATVFVPDPATERQEGACRTWTELRPETVSIPSTGDPAKHALQALVAAPRPALPEVGEFSRQDGSSYTVRSVVSDGGVITVDLDKDPWDPWSTASLVCETDGELAMQQIVRTAQAALDSDDPVLLTVNGAPAQGIGTVPLHGPVEASTDRRRLDDEALEGTWDVGGLIDEEGRSVMPPELRGKVRLTFKDGEFRGFTGCNTLQGTYSRHRSNGDDRGLTIDVSSTTRAGCMVEAPLMERLGTVRYTTVADGYRYLHNARSMIVASLRQR